MTTQTLKIKCLKFNGHKIELSENIHNKPVARLFKLLTVGKNKDSYKLIKGYYFRDEARREEWINEQMTAIKSRLTDKETAKATKNEALTNNPYKVGEVLYQSWGYDQTNVDFFEIIEVGAKSFAY